MEATLHQRERLLSREARIRIVKPRYSPPYPVVVGRGLLGDAGRWLGLAGLEPRRCMVAYQGGVSALASRLAGSLRGVCDVDEAMLPDGEEAKSLDVVLSLIGKLYERNYSRRDVIVVVGGGAASDSAGFAAAVYKRGIPYVNVPTTLLSMVDAAVGGKVAVNYRGVKNVLGAFYQPRLVLEDLDALSTLPRLELLSGAGELVKYAYTLSEGLYRLVKGGELLERIDEAVYLGVEAKAVIVELDEREEYGVREILNYGHTFGHALEALTGIRHGVAVAWGCVVEAWAGVRLGYTPEWVAAELQNVVESLGFPQPPLPPWEKLEALMRRDKKVYGDRIRGVFTLGPARGAVIEVMLHDYLSAVRWGVSRVWGGGSA